jgi:hypothetical protein
MRALRTAGWRRMQVLAVPPDGMSGREFYGGSSPRALRNAAALDTATVGWSPPIRTPPRERPCPLCRRPMHGALIRYARCSARRTGS